MMDYLIPYKGVRFGYVVVIEVNNRPCSEAALPGPAARRCKVFLSFESFVHLAFE